MRKPFAVVALLLMVAGATWWWWGSRGTSDVALWLGWMDEVQARGPRLGYVAIHADYPPGASLVLWVVGTIASGISTDPRIVLKLVLLGFLLATTGTLLIASRRPGLSAFAHAALVVNSFALMYLDIFTAPFLLGAIWAGRAGREPLMAALLAGACLMKWQPLLVLPFAVVYVIRLRGTTSSSIWRRKAALAAASAAAVLLWILPVYGFAAVWDALYRAGHHNDLSNFGANPLWILTWWFERTASPGQPTLSPEGWVLIDAASRPILRALSLITLVGYGSVLRAYWKSDDRRIAGMVRFSLAGYLVYFLCSAGVHENHLFLAVVLATALAWLEPRHTWMAVLLAVSATINLVLFYGWDGGGAVRTVHGVDDTVWLAIAVSIAVAYILWRLVRRQARVQTLHDFGT